MAGEITTVSERFYSGMTKDEAQTQDFKSMSLKQRIRSIFLTNHNFEDIDLNKDGILQGAEICAERDAEVAGRRSMKNKALAIGVLGLAAAATVTMPWVGIALAVSGIASFTYGLIDKKSGQETQKTELYRQEYLYNKNA